MTESRYRLATMVASLLLLVAYLLVGVELRHPVVERGIEKLLRGILGYQTQPMIISYHEPPAGAYQKPYVPAMLPPHEFNFPDNPHREESFHGLYLESNPVSVFMCSHQIIRVGWEPHVVRIAQAGDSYKVVVRMYADCRTVHGGLVRMSNYHTETWLCDEAGVMKLLSEQKSSHDELVFGGQF
jgi:hypothetical protein